MHDANLRLLDQSFERLRVYVEDTCMLPPTNDPNEAVPVIDYIVQEMNTNAKGEDAAKMRELNAYSGEACISEWRKYPIWKQLLLGNMPRTCVETEMSSHQAAMVMWALNVRQDGPWDHKPKIRKKFHPRVPNGEQVWHRLGEFDYFYDIWSNVHYGYVGIACGFSKSALLDGAGLEQIGSDIFRGRMPSSRPGVSGTRSYDDPSDQASIGIGIQLYGVSPGSLSTKQVRDAVVASPDLTKRATPKELMKVGGPR